MEVKLLDHGYVTLVETYGSDERIIEAARMSTNKGFQGWGPKPCPQCEKDIAAEESGSICFIDNKSTGCGGGLNPPMCDGSITVPGDEKLLRFLYEHQHMTPFEMAGAVFEVQAPIMVFREWQRHRTQSYNEMSGRYTELPDLYYIPSIDRLMTGKQALANKQGSISGFTYEEAIRFRDRYKQVVAHARGEYDRLIADGVSRELARLLLPVNQYSRMRASANLRNWMAFLTLRMDTSAQWEIRQYANVVHSMLSAMFPRTLALFDEGK